jgi:hypothetical protein
MVSVPNAAGPSQRCLMLRFSYWGFALLIAANEVGSVPHAIAHQVGTLGPVPSLFAALLGVNPLQHLLAASRARSSLPAGAQLTLTGREFLPNLISGPFHQGLVVVFAVVAGLSPLAARLSPARRPLRSTTGRRRATATAHHLSRLPCRLAPQQHPADLSQARRPRCDRGSQPIRRR